MGCSTNTVYAMDPNNSVIKRLWCTNNRAKVTESFHRLYIRTLVIMFCICKQFNQSSAFTRALSGPLIPTNIIFSINWAMQKCVFRHVGTAKAQICLGICSLIRAFTVCKQNHWILQNVQMGSKGLDDTLHMCRMV